MDIATLVQQMVDSGQFQQLADSTLTQFGPRTDQYLGATILPEQNREENYYREEAIQYRTVIANHAGRYSPPALKGSVLTGYMEVSLGESDIASKFDAQDYDTLLRILSRAGRGGTPPMQAVTNLLSWADTSLIRPLAMINEKMRWDAIVDASVVRNGENDWTETIAYPNPAGHRFNAGGDWDNDAYDPYDDILAAANILTGKGYQVGRIIAGTPVINKLLANAKIQQKVGKISVAAGTVVGLPGRLTKGQLDAIMSDDNLPPIEKYNAQWRDQQTSDFFLKRNVMVMLARTGKDQTIDTGDKNPLSLFNTLGYMGIGRPAGQTGPGRVIMVNPELKHKPPHIMGEAWQTSLPVIQDPEAVVVIQAID